MKKLLRVILWAAVALAGAAGLAAIAFERGEPLNATWFIVAAACTFLVAYRFYSAFIAAKVLALDPHRATPAERLDDGRDFVPTNKWVLLGHHFAAIAGPGPLVGPTLAAQFGYLPGTLWLIIGSVLGGCVQDFVVLFCSIRRDGKSLGQMAREEVGKWGGIDRATRCPHHHDYSSRRRRARGRQCAEIFAVGHLHSRDDSAHRHARRTLLALLAAGPRSRSFRNRRCADSFRSRRRTMGRRVAVVGARVHSKWRRACDLADRLRIRSLGASRFGCCSRRAII